jgi:hypothetical protein
LTPPATADPTAAPPRPSGSGIEADTRAEEAPTDGEPIKTGSADKPTSHNARSADKPASNKARSCSDTRPGEPRCTDPRASEARPAADPRSTDPGTGEARPAADPRSAAPADPRSAAAAQMRPAAHSAAMALSQRACPHRRRGERHCRGNG